MSDPAKLDRPGQKKDKKLFLQMYKFFRYTFLKSAFQCGLVRRYSRPFPRARPERVSQTGAARRAEPQTSPNSFRNFEMSKVYTFVSNRGGSGKSTLTSQVSAAIALNNPNKTVVVLDFSIQGDASVALLGGISEPTTFTPGVATRGAENIAALPPTKSAFNFINDARRAGTASTANTAPTGGSWWRGSTVAAPNRSAVAAFDWADS